MEDNQWVFDLETTIFSIVKAKAMGKLKARYPNINITDSSKSTSKATFPTVYIHELPGVEYGADLGGRDINAVLETIQVDVTTNTNQRDAKIVMSGVAGIFKEMRFESTAMPEFDGSDGTYRSTARFRRVIGANDALL